VLPIVGGFCLLIALFAAPLLAVFGRDFAARARGAGDVRGSGRSSAYIQMVLAAALTAKRMTRYVFLGTVGGALVTLFFELRADQVDGNLWRAGGNVC